MPGGRPVVADDLKKAITDLRLSLNTDSRTTAVRTADLRTVLDAIERVQNLQGYEFDASVCGDRKVLKLTYEQALEVLGMRHV